MSKMPSKGSGSHEYCQGYVDKNGIWNNGFYCRRWGGQDVTYCCGDGQNRFCCPEVPHLITPTVENSTASVDSFNYIPLVIGICAVLVVVLVVFIMVAFSCLLCSCCPVHKKRRIRKENSLIALNGTIPICTEAEVTSSVIAAEALQGPCRDLTLHPSNLCGRSTATGLNPILSQDKCYGCRGTVRPWSPTICHTTMEGFDSVALSSFCRHNETTDMPWHPEIQNMCNCNCRPKLKLEPKQRDTNFVLCSTGNSIAFRQSEGCPSPLRFESFGLKRSCMSDEAQTSPYGKQTTIEPSAPRLSPYRTGGVLSSPSAHGRFQPQFRIPASLTSEAERHKRDSGVLVEEQDTSDNSRGSPLCLGVVTDDLLTIVPRTTVSMATTDFTWNNSR